MAKINRRMAVAGGGIVLVTSTLVAFVSSYEGTRYRPYRDVGNVWTVCEGITGKHVIPGKEYTRAECDALLGGEIEKHGRGLLACITRPISQNQYEALASWTFNVGVGAACKSSLVRRLNAGDPPAEWCNELMKWNKAAGVTWRGLTRRREAERSLCLS